MVVDLLQKCFADVAAVRYAIRSVGAILHPPLFTLSRVFHTGLYPSLFNKWAE